MYHSIKQFLAAFVTCAALVFSGGVSAQASQEDCVVSQAGNNIAERMGVLSTQSVRRAVTPALRKYNLGCLARTINLGGFGRIGAGIGSAIRRMIGSISGDALCQVVLDAITDARPAEPVRDAVGADATRVAWRDIEVSLIAKESV